MPRKRLTRGEKVVAFIEKYCSAPEGDLLGKPIKLLPFQRRFILDVYDNPAGTSRAYLSMARKNGKTALIACLLLAHLVVRRHIRTVGSHPAPEPESRPRRFSTTPGRW